MDAVRTTTLVVGLASAGVGIWRDNQTSEVENPGGGLWGVFRPQSARGFVRGLPFYVVAAVGIGLAAFLP